MPPLIWAMPTPLRIALVGDYNRDVTAHQAIPRALALAQEATGVAVAPVWVSTEQAGAEVTLREFGAVWCVPASPYRSTAGALAAIRLARTTPLPFLGTCGGFQHALLEYARAVLGWQDAAHAELDPAATRAVIAPLACALVETRGRVRFEPGSRLAEAYGVAEAEEGYHCRFGVNPEFLGALTAGSLCITARDPAGEVRGVELAGHPFFVAT